MRPPFRPRQGDFSSWVEKSSPERAAAARELAHAFVQSSRPMDGSQRSALRAAGIDILEWVEGDLYTASLRLGGRFARTPASAAAELGLLSVSRIPAAEKLSDWFTGPNAPEWSRRDWRGEPAFDVVVLLHRDAPVEETAREFQAAGWGILSELPEFHRLTARVPERDLWRMAEFDEVYQIEPASPPMARHDNAVSASMMGASELFQAPYNLTGKGVRVGMLDEGRVSVHQDLRGRVTAMEVYNWDSDHSTHVAGTIAGNGASDPARKGLAPESLLFWATFDGDFVRKTLSAVVDRSLVAVNNSWGAYLYGSSCNLYGAYTADARDYDRIVREGGASIVFSMGNDRDGYSCPILPTRGGFYSTAFPASAKNVISVGALERGTGLGYFSNFGPTRDGRLKPDLVALGVDVQSLGLRDDGAVMSGTSMAAPAVTGAVALLAERFLQKHGEARPQPALVKALLLGTAKDLGNAGPDYSYGFGLPDLKEAVRAIDERQFETASIGSGEWSKTVPVPGDAKTLRVTLVWSDPEGPVNSRAALVNDLDLTVDSGGETHLPLTPDPMRPALEARRAVNHRDNVEQVVLAKPAAGEVVIRVKPFRMGTETQAFAVVWSFAEQPPPACITSLSPRSFDASELGGDAVIGMNRPSHCSPGLLENPAPWVVAKSNGDAPLGDAVKLRVLPNDADGTRHTMLRLGGAEIRIRQTGPCVRKPLPEGGEFEFETNLSDCLYLGDYTKVFQFAGQAGQKVRLSVTSPHFTSWIQLRAPNGLSMGSVSGRPAARAYLPSASSMLTLPMTGQYLIYASGLDEAYGPLRINVEYGDPDTVESRADVPALIPECPFESEDSLGERSTDGGRRGDLYWTNSYLVRAYAGQRIEVQVKDIDFDSYIYLISPNGSLYTQNDDAPAGGGSSLAVTLPEGGDWRLEITSFSPLTTGRYGLNVKGCSARAK